MAEKLKLVTDFAELRPGMIVVIKDCIECGRPERGMLTKLSIVSEDDEYPQDVGSIGWEMVPNCPADDDSDYGSLIGAPTIQMGIVYRVVDDLENTNATHTAKPKRLAPTLPESR